MLKTFLLNKCYRKAVNCWICKSDLLLKQNVSSYIFSTASKLLFINYKNK